MTLRDDYDMWAHYLPRPIGKSWGAFLDYAGLWETWLYESGGVLHLGIDSQTFLQIDAPYVRYNDTHWEDLRVPANSIRRLGFSDPDWVQFADNGAGSVGVFNLAFSNTVDEEVFFDVQMPHNWKQGTDIEPHVHWAPSTAAAGGVTWGLEYTWANINGAFGNTTIITADDSTDATSHKHHVADWTAITGSGKTISSMLSCRLFRDISDANDTYAADAFLKEFDFHYEVDSPGSEGEYTKA